MLAGVRTRRLFAVISVADADALAQRAHGDDQNRSGVLFIDHVRSVATRMQDDPDPYAVPAALLHDTVEKSWMTWDDLREAGADDRLIALVDALTERDGESEESYLSRAATDPLALRIKRADIADKLHMHVLELLADTHRQAVESRARRRLSILESMAEQLHAQSPEVS
jgi:(p)ppGpp synthase/HD superfamily hydrolase